MRRDRGAMRFVEQALRAHCKVRRALGGARGASRYPRAVPAVRTVENSVLNIHARAAMSRVLDPLGEWLAKAGVSANLITVIGSVGAVVGGLLFFSHGWWFSGAVLIWACVMLDMVDGAVARASGSPTAFGGVLDSTGDRVADAAIFGGIAWYYARHDGPAMLAAALLCLVLGSVTSYIRARAEAAGLTAAVGIAERAERLIIVLVGTGLLGLGVPYVQAIALWLLVAASAVTVGQRMATVYHQSERRG